MYVVYGNIYTFIFEEETITIESKIPHMHSVQITSNLNEDFSIFFLGGYIAEDVKMLANTCKIDGETYLNVYLHVLQSVGRYIRFEVRRQPQDIQTEPIDSGEQLLFIDDIIRKIE